MKPRTWWRPPRDAVSRSFARNGMPPTLFGCVRARERREMRETRRSLVVC